MTRALHLCHSRVIYAGSTQQSVTALRSPARGAESLNCKRHQMAKAAGCAQRGQGHAEPQPAHDRLHDACRHVGTDVRLPQQRHQFEGRSHHRHQHRAQAFQGAVDHGRIHVLPDRRRPVPARHDRCGQQWTITTIPVCAATPPTAIRPTKSLWPQAHPKMTIG